MSLTFPCSCHNKAEHIHFSLALQKSLLRGTYKLPKPRGTILCYHNMVLLCTMAPEVLSFCSSYFPPISVRQLWHKEVSPGGGIGDSHKKLRQTKEQPVVYQSKASLLYFLYLFLLFYFTAGTKMIWPHSVQAEVQKQTGRGGDKAAI